MSRCVNQITLVGNVGADPIVRETKKGKKVANIRLATSESFTDKETGEVTEYTEWHTVVTFNQHIISVIERFVQKGKRLLLTGKLQYRDYEPKDAEPRQVAEIILDDTLTLL